MIIFLYGEDSYRSRQKLNEIIENYKKAQKGGLSLRYFEDKELSYQDFKDELQTPSLFAKKKLIILKDVFVSKEFEESFLNEGKKFTISEDLILFYQEGEVSKNKLFQFLKKNAKSQEFKLLQSQELKGWIKKEFEKCQAKPNEEAIEKLIEFAGNDLWRVANEVNKLASFKKGKEILAKDVELLVKPNIEVGIFKTIDAIAAKDKKLALKLLHKHIEKGDSPFYLLSMINYQFRTILEVRDLIERRTPYQRISQQTKLHPFVLKKSYYLAQKFTIEELKKIYQEIFEVDLNIKTGKIEPETALDLFIAGV